MKKFLVFVLVLGLLPAAAVFAQDVGNLRYSITVTKFTNRANISGQYRLTDSFAALLTDSLQQTGKFIVLGEKDMRNEAMNEQDFGESGRVAKGKMTPEIGKMTPAQLLVKGEITHFQESTTGGGGGVSIMGVSVGGGIDHAEINAVIYVVDSTTGQVVASKKVVGSASRAATRVGVSHGPISTDMNVFRKSNVGSAVEKAIDEAVEFISGQLGKIPWEGSVVMVKGNKIYINRGSREGVAVGQRFSIGEVERLTDPDSGELLDISVNKVASVKVESVKEKLSIAAVTEGAENIRKGMTVVLP
jgi:curli biogenesis system outer membrane secretion channel CsgG